MYAPMGVGALYARRELHREIAPIIHGGGQQNGLRSGTLPTALCVGLGAAARLLSSDKSADERSALARRRDLFLERLQEMPYVVWINGPTDSSLRHPGNINIGFKGVAAADLLAKLQPQLAASTGAACTSGIAAPSHVLRAIGLSDQDAAASIRFSLGRYTSDDDVEEASNLIREALDALNQNGLLQSA